MKTKYFNSCHDKVFIKEVDGLITQIIHFMDDMCIDISNFEGDARCKRREHSGQFEIQKEEYEFWMDIATRIKNFREKRIQLN